MDNEDPLNLDRARVLLKMYDMYATIVDRSDEYCFRKGALKGKKIRPYLLSPFAPHQKKDRRRPFGAGRTVYRDARHFSTGANLLKAVKEMIAKKHPIDGH